MNTSMRVLLDITFRSVALLVLSEAVAAIYAAAEPNDGLGTGLTAMFVLVCAAASWGLWDGFHRSPARLCVTWVMTGIVVSLGQTLYSHLRFGEWSWSELANDMSSGLVFWAGLIFVPAIIFGIVQSVASRSAEVPVRDFVGGRRDERLHAVRVARRRFDGGDADDLSQTAGQARAELGERVGVAAGESGCA